MTDFFDRSRRAEFRGELAELLGEAVLNHRYLERLDGVSYLGALDYALRIPTELRYSRYDHALGVGFLVLQYCRILEVSRTETYLAVLAALIHDIGHGPFAHSIEFLQFLRADESSQSHESNLKTSKIEALLRDCHECLPDNLSDKFRTNPRSLSLTIKHMTEASRFVENSDVRKMFYNPFCPDTFEGVGRAVRVLSRDPERFCLDPAMLLNEISSCKRPLTVRSSGPPGDGHVLLRFHRQMQYLYEEIIDLPENRAAEAMLVRAADLGFPKDQTIPYSTLKDSQLVRRMRNNELSNSLWSSLEKGVLFRPLSSIDPHLHASAVTIYYTVRRQEGLKIRDAFKQTQEHLSRQLHIPTDEIIPHVFRNLIWNRSNIFFKDAGPKMWEIRWRATEGTYNTSPVIEFYIPGAS